MNVYWHRGADAQSLHVNRPVNLCARTGSARNTLFRSTDTSALDLGALFTASPNAYVIFDRELRIAGCNAAYLAVVGGRNSADILGRHLFDAFPSDPDSASYKLLRRSLDKVLDTGVRDHIAVIPYDTSQPGEAPNVRFWSATHTPILDHDGALQYILQHTVDVTELQRLRERDAWGFAKEAGVLERALEVQAANQLITAESRLLRDMFQQAPGFMALLAGPAHTFIQANDAYLKIVGRNDIVGRTVAEALPEVVTQGFIDLLDTVYASGTPYLGTSVPVQLGGEFLKQKYIDFVYQPVRDNHGSVSGIFVQGHDVTDKVEAERLQALRHRELGHRLKNQLSVVQAVVNQTFRTAPDLATAGKTIADRFQALAGAHEILIRGGRDRSTVQEIVDSSIRMLDDDRRGRVIASGPELEVGSRPALSLSLILHELSTNAVKYGALSNQAGHVRIGWEVIRTADGNRFTLEWREVGGPLVEPPQSTGAGTRLIRAGLSGTSDTRIEIDYAVGGLVCTIVTDLASFSSDEA